MKESGDIPRSFGSTSSADRLLRALDSLSERAAGRFRLYEKIAASVLRDGQDASVLLDGLLERLGAPPGPRASHAVAVLGLALADCPVEKSGWLIETIKKEKSRGDDNGLRRERVERVLSGATQSAHSDKSQWTALLLSDDVVRRDRAVMGVYGLSASLFEFGHLSRLKEVIDAFLPLFVDILAHRSDPQGSCEVQHIRACMKRWSGMVPDYLIASLVKIADVDVKADVVSASALEAHRLLRNDLPEWLHDFHERVLKMILEGGCSGASDFAERNVLKINLLDAGGECAVSTVIARFRELADVQTPSGQVQAEFLRQLIVQFGARAIGSVLQMCRESKAVLREAGFHCLYDLALLHLGGTSAEFPDSTCHSDQERRGPLSLDERKIRIYLSSPEVELMVQNGMSAKQNPEYKYATQLCRLLTDNTLRDTVLHSAHRSIARTDAKVAGVARYRAAI